MGRRPAVHDEGRAVYERRFRRAEEGGELGDFSGVAIQVEHGNRCACLREPLGASTPDPARRSVTMALCFVRSTLTDDGPDVKETSLISSFIQEITGPRQDLSPKRN